jgi:hypothetical protein
LILALLTIRMMQSLYNHRVTVKDRSVPLTQARGTTGSGATSSPTQVSATTEFHPVRDVRGPLGCDMTVHLEF